MKAKIFVLLNMLIFMFLLVSNTLQISVAQTTQLSPFGSSKKYERVYLTSNHNQLDETPGVTTSGVTERISISSSGVEGNRSSSISHYASPASSADGRFIVFASSATNLIINDTNNMSDVFVHDRLTGETSLVSMAFDGAQANYGGGESAISEDGRFVAFVSSANNLVPDDNNGQGDVFVHDRQTRNNFLISKASDGTQANATSSRPSISGDGVWVAFHSYASNLVPDDTNNFMDIFAHNINTGQTIRVSVASDGTQANSYSWHPAISADGRYVVFDSNANNLVDGDANNTVDVFLHNLQTYETSKVSVAYDGTDANNGSFVPTISSDGRYVSFYSSASNLVDDDTNGHADVFVHDRQIGKNALVSKASDGTQGDNYSRFPSISSDGRYVAFESIAENLVPNDTNNLRDIFVHDQQTGETTRVSISSFDEEGNNNSLLPSISGDGYFVAFESLATNLVIDDTNGNMDVFVHDRRMVSETHSISGQVTDGDSNAIEGVTISANTGLSDITDFNGNYTITGLLTGTYTITPSKNGWTFTPTNQVVSVPSSATPWNFIGQHKPIVVLVHGWQGFSETTLDCNPLNLEQTQREIFQYDQEPPINFGAEYALDYWGDLPNWLIDDYDVWIAQLKTGRVQGTPSLEYNGECLRNQIKYVARQSGHFKVTLIAHSMGGLVSRACLNHSDCYQNVDTLVTLGSPHVGLPFSGIANILGIVDCLSAPGGCEMSIENMNVFNSSHPNSSAVDYLFIGGDGRSGPRDAKQDLWSALGTGPNDGLVGKYNAVGWNYDSTDLIIWALANYPEQYWTDEFHSRAFSIDDGVQVRDDYYHMRYEHPWLKSNAYECFTVLLAGIASPATCVPANLSIALTNAETVTSSPYQSIQLLDGVITTGETISNTLPIDSDGKTIFYTAWQTDTLTMHLKRPDGQIIDPTYAASHPEEVVYDDGTGGGETPPFATYSFTNTIPGTWTLIVDASSLSIVSTGYWSFALLESNRILEAGEDDYYYQAGDTAILTATLERDGSGLAGATINANITRSDSITETITMIDQGGGNYSANYTIPNAPGYLSIAIMAEGNDAGTDFTRQSNLLATIAPQDAQFNAAYSDQGNDGNGDGLYEYLDFTADVEVSNAGNYIVSALLVSGDGQLITSLSVGAVLAVGTHSITLPFNGDDIHALKIDGPYTVTNLQITEINSGVPSQIINDAHVTQSYVWSDFGSSLPNIYLPLVIK